MTSIQFDYSKLRGRIREKIGSESKFAELLGISSVSLSARLNNRIGFSNPEILAACAILDIDKADIGSYFFEK